MGLKKNILYSSFLTASNYLFQFITYPYVARVLGVTGVGVCNFSQSLVQYFILFSTLGIMTLGTREIAKCNGDKNKQSVVFSSLFELILIVTLIVTLIYIGCIECIPKLAEYRELLYIGVFQLIFNTLTIEWLFRGIEDFKYITIRTFWVKCVYVVLIFFFIRNEDDYLRYFAITVGVYVANGIINLLYSRKKVLFSWQPIGKVFKRYMHPILILGIYGILTNMYLSFNVMYLGFVANDTQVGYYTTATKIENIILALYSSFTLVMMPRISSMLAQKNTEGVKNAVKKSLNLLYAFAFPIVILSIVFSDQIILIVAGQGYEHASILLKIAMPVMLIVGIEQILIVQLLLPLGEDKAVFTNALIGASVSIILNIALTQRLESMGSVIVWFAAELSVMLSAFFFVKKKFGNVLFIKDLINYIIIFIPLLGVCYLFLKILPNGYYSITLAAIFTFIYSHICFVYVIKNELYQEFWLKLKDKLL